MMKSTMTLKAQFLFVVAVWGAGGRGVAAEVDRKTALHYIQIHSWLMWSSMGFLFPLGAILIRYSRPQRDLNSDVSPGRTRLLLYLHSTVQCGAVGAATAGIAILLKEFGPTFYHTHMRLGLSVWIIAMLMPVISILRPAKGTQLRPFWLFVHWFLGTGVVVLGIVNCFIGIFIYQFHHGSIRSLNTAFSIQVAVMGLVYCLQDRLSYILGQGSKAISYQPGKVAHHPIMEREMFPGTV